MKDLEKVQKTLSDVCDYLNGNNLQLVGKELLTDVCDAHRIVENLAINGVSNNEADEVDLDFVVKFPVKQTTTYKLVKKDSEVASCKGMHALDKPVAVICENCGDLKNP